MKSICLPLAAALVFCGCAAVLCPALADGGEPRVVVLASSQIPIYEEVVQGFRKALADGGHPVRVDTVVLSEDNAATVRALRDAKLVFTLGSSALRAATEARADLPVVAGMVARESDIRGAGGKVTGVSLQHSLTTQFRHLGTILPSARKVAFLYSEKENGDAVKRAAKEAASAGLELLPIKIESPEQIPRALEDVSRSADVLWGIPDRVVLNSSTAREVLLFSFRNRVPFVGLSSSWVKSGALYALGWDYQDIGAQCGTMAAAVLAGRRPESIPPKGPRKVQLAVNQKTFARMKVDMSEAILKNAAQIY